MSPLLYKAKYITVSANVYPNTGRSCRRFFSLNLLTISCCSMRRSTSLTQYVTRGFSDPYKSKLRRTAQNSDGDLARSCFDPCCTASVYVSMMT